MVESALSIPTRPAPRKFLSISRFTCLCFLCFVVSERSFVLRRHPGCLCPQGFTGEKCEYTINKSTTKAASEDGVHPARTRNSSDSMKGIGIAAIVLSVCAILAIGMFVISGCLRRKRFRRREGETSGLIWANKGGYKDNNTETVNFSPKGGYSDDYMASFANPSRDPMATALAPDTSEAVESDTSTGQPESESLLNEDPQIFIGPPTVRKPAALNTLLCLLFHTHTSILFFRTRTDTSCTALILFRYPEHAIIWKLSNFCCECP